MLFSSSARSEKRLGEQRQRRRPWGLVVVGGGGWERTIALLALAAAALLLLLVVVLLLRSVATVVVVSPMIESAHLEAWRISLRTAVPSCPASPWKADEDLRGDCRAELKPLRRSSGGGPDDAAAAATTATVAECAKSCCEDPTCVSWQHRRDVGCLVGGDVRLGMEKDGVPAWCSDHPPHRWRGQFLGGRGGADGGLSVVESRTLACDESSWNPEEEVGQCFGLGDVRPGASGSAVECMRACCDDPTCGAWQWNEVVRAPGDSSPR
jgi:hypothetical protein